MSKSVCLLLVICVIVKGIIGAPADDNLAAVVKHLQEQVSALLENRQRDYNALEASLKAAIEKNTELIVLRNEVKQLKKEVTGLRGGSGNEAKNDKLRMIWLGNTVTELRSEVAEVLKARNASERLAERAMMRSELSLLKSDVAEVGKGVRDLGGRITMIEAKLSAIRYDITAVKERASQLSRTCTDVSSQLSTVQIELKSLNTKGYHHDEHGKTINEANNDILQAHPVHHARHGSSKLLLHRVEERLVNLERKIAIVARKRSTIEKRVVYENQHYLTERVKNLETAQHELSRKLYNTSRDLSTARSLGESMVQLFETVEELENKLDSNQSDTKRELSRLDINAARKAAELSLTRENLDNLRRTVQALSVSASKLQEKSDQQQEMIGKLNETLNKFDMKQSLARATNMTRELEEAEDKYHLIVDALPGNCDDRNGLTLLAPGPGSPMLTSCKNGWIVVGRRIDGMVDFDRTWNEYATGFGSPLSEYWIGNEALHRLTRDNCSRLKIDLIDINGVKWTAKYENIHVDSEETGYKLKVSGYSGNATDALSYQNGMAFSAKDRDMDISPTDCAANYHGGWWFSHCQHANLNGMYALGLTWFKSDNNEWMAVASSEMSVQKKEQC